VYLIVYIILGLVLILKEETKLAFQWNQIKSTIVFNRA